MLQPHLLQKEVGLSTCDQHGEQEMFFCEEDQRPLCDSCLSAPEHKDHQVLPLETAADKCKKKLREIWRILQKKEEKFQTALDTLRRRQDQFTERTYILRESAISEYGKIHRFLMDEEYQRLERLGQQSRDNVAKMEEKEHELTQQIQNVRQMVFQVEENLDMMPLEMIQAVPDTLKKKEELVLQRPALPSTSWPTCPVTGMRNAQEFLQGYNS
ncbi:E3 ubiquitin-protein ligase TRIM17-like [Sarcophilus harrisii]|uniref:E3 ubiquitin-protein ligase TRIM17-like n=1 Tax=Sarcophilus harrisii TaxID=9305 RepID=UPI001301EECE|nr:E3 ubiquitin-protein ligase TRIM17-like [Sarcophilus harrisii]